jgi:hypothetical protein
MARKVKDKALDSREARSKLKVRGKSYWRTIERGLHLGYRRRGNHIRKDRLAAVGFAGARVSGGSNRLCVVEIARRSIGNRR